MKQPRLWNRQLQGDFTEGLAEDLKQDPGMPRVGSRTLQAVSWALDTPALKKTSRNKRKNLKSAGAD